QAKDLETKVNKFWSQGERAEAIAAWQKKIRLEREVWGKVHVNVASSLAILASLYEIRENYPAAIGARQEVLAIKTKLLGKKHWQVIDAGLALADTERLANLDRNQRQRLAKANLLNQKVVALYGQGKFQAAVPLAQQAVEIRGETLGANHPHYALSLNNLALL